MFYFVINSANIITEKFTATSRVYFLLNFTKDIVNIYIYIIIKLCKKIAFAQIWAYLDNNSSLDSQMLMKWCTNIPGT